MQKTWVYSYGLHEVNVALKFFKCINIIEPIPSPSRPLALRPLTVKSLPTPLSILRVHVHPFNMYRKSWIFHVKIFAQWIFFKQSNDRIPIVLLIMCIGFHAFNFHICQAIQYLVFTICCTGVLYIYIYLYMCLLYFSMQCCLCFCFSSPLLPFSSPPSTTSSSSKTLRGKYSTEYR